MRKRFHHQRVCSCSPSQGVFYLEARLLREIVNQEIHPIRCASTCGRKAQKGLLLGDLCAEAHHPQWALKIWKFVIRQIHYKDDEDWSNVWFNTQYVSLKDVISDGICEILGRRIDELHRRYGLAEPKGRDSWEYWAGDGWYNSLFYDKYDYDWDYWRGHYLQERDEAMAQQATNRIFREGLGDVPPCAQGFFDYWEDNALVEEDLNYKIDDWD